MMKFRIGDLVISTTDKYSVTHTKAICKVLSSYTDNEMYVEVVGYLDDFKGKNLIGDRWSVEARLFKPYNPLSV